MASKGKAKRKGKGRSFIMLRYDLIDSAAFRSLPSEARAVYIQIKRRFNGFNNGDIPLSCREAATQCNISKTTASRSLSCLLDRQFIRIGEDAGFNQKSGRRARRWILTEEPLHGKPATNDWRRWQVPLKSRSRFQTGDGKPLSVPQGVYNGSGQPPCVPVGVRKAAIPNS